VASRAPWTPPRPSGASSSPRGRHAVAQKPPAPSPLSLAHLLPSLAGFREQPRPRRSAASHRRGQWPPHASPGCPLQPPTSSSSFAPSNLSSRAPESTIASTDRRRPPWSNSSIASPPSPPSPLRRLHWHWGELLFLPDPPALSPVAWCIEFAGARAQPPPFLKPPSPQPP